MLLKKHRTADCSNQVNWKVKIVSDSERKALILAKEGNGSCYLFFSLSKKERKNSSTISVFSVDFQCTKIWQQIWLLDSALGSSIKK